MNKANLARTSIKQSLIPPHTCVHHHHHHHHHHVQEGLGLIPVPCILKMKLVPPSLPRSSYVSSSFGLYCSACLGILFVSIVCMCCSHSSWYCFISFTIFSAPVFSLIQKCYKTIFVYTKCAFVGFMKEQLNSIKMHGLNNVRKVICGIQK